MKTQGLPADGRALPISGEQSAAVRAAQQRLAELRRQNGTTSGGRPPTADPYGQRTSGPRSLAEWLPLPLPQPEPAPAEPAPPEPEPADSALRPAVKVYPDVAMAILRRKKAAAGRVWLLLRHRDAEGRGRVALDDAIRLLTRDETTRICGRRQLGNLLAAGDGLFWRRDTDRAGGQWLRLASTARVAAGLGVPRLALRPVAVPVAHLTGTIGQARAHLYAAFHSGRSRVDLLSGRKHARGPIARSTLCQISGASANSQRNYERRAAVGRKSAIALGPRVQSADEQEMAWRRGNALFRLHDRQGRFGRPGATYLAWQLPNEYTGPHEVLSRGRLKRLNRALDDLFHDGMTGNIEPPTKQIRNDESGITNYELRIRNDASHGGPSSLVTRHSTLVTQHLTLVTQHLTLVTPKRCFYNTAKSALMARHDRERYWRYRDGAWLWQPEVNTSHS